MRRPITFRAGHPEREKPQLQLNCTCRVNISGIWKLCVDWAVAALVELKQDRVKTAQSDPAE